MWAPTSLMRISSGAERSPDVVDDLLGLDRKAVVVGVGGYLVQQIAARGGRHTGPVASATLSKGVQGGSNVADKTGIDDVVLVDLGGGRVDVHQLLPRLAATGTGGTPPCRIPRIR